MEKISPGLEAKVAKVVNIEPIIWSLICKSNGRGHTQRALSPVLTGRFPIKNKIIFPLRQENSICTNFKLKIAVNKWCSK